MAASSSSLAATPPSEQSTHGIELADRKSAQFGTKEIFEQQQSDGSDDYEDATRSTNVDRYAMERMGKKQVLVRHFRPMATFSFVAMATSVWEFGIFSMNQGLIDGGRAGLMASFRIDIPLIFWGTLIHAVGFIPIILSMAEMASIAPTAGSQYHWVSEFASPRWQKILSYYTGWMSTMAWQAGNAVGVFLTGTLIQTIILENNNDYAFPSWHGSLLVISNIVFTVAANILLTRYIPRVQTAFFVLHILAFFAVMVPICINAPKASAAQVFTEFENTGGWSSMGLAVCAGQLSAIYMMCGTDSACSVAEEVRNAAKTVPRSMIGIFFVDMAFTITCWLVLCFAMPDTGVALEHISTYPVIYILEQSMSTMWVTLELVLIVALVLFANVCYITAVSRDLWAFSRDNGVPFSPWICKIHPKYMAPVNAIYVTALFSFLLSLIYIGSETAFYAITSLMTVALLQCYMFSIGSILWRRIYLPDTIPKSSFSLGRWGIPINSVAFIWCMWSFFWSFWPQATPTTVDGFNWSSVIFASVIIAATIYYFLEGRKNYHGPVVLVKKM